MRRLPHRLQALVSRAVLAIVLATFARSPALAASLDDELGRNETRIWSAPFGIPSGVTAKDLGLLERLERQGYRRVHQRPAKPGEFFLGTEVIWIWRRACHARGSDRPDQLFGLDVDPRTARIIGRRDPDGKSRPIADDNDAWLEPELLAESLTGDRAARVPVRLAALPERVWRPVLAAEDARFFEHPGVDPIGVARAALHNVKKGEISEGGSTITQQLVKNRDLSPKRTLGRKASEAVRALSLETEHSKNEILESYLNTVYLGNVRGLAVHGIGTGARVYFSKPAESLGLAEAAALAAMIQAPNRLSPIDHAQALRERRNWVLGRMEELEWAKRDEVERAKAQPVTAKSSSPRRTATRQLVAWVADRVEAEKPSRVEDGRGFLVETTIDPMLQDQAESAVARGLDALRRRYPKLRSAGLAAALIALDARSGAVLAYVGNDPGEPSRSFDNARTARRQPGSIVKPFVVLQALEECGRQEPLTASSRIDDSPLTIDLPTSDWTPRNFDGRFLGPVLLRDALAESRNVPAVRIARWCGWGATAETFERAGFELPKEPPPSFVLGSVETSPLQVARAYTVFATPGRVLDPFLLRKVETPGGRGLASDGRDAHRVSSAEAAFIVRDLMRTAVERGTAATGDIRGLDVAAKTGSSSDLRDAWFAGQAGSVVAVLWIGLEGSGRLGLTGSLAAGPIWSDFMTKAAPERPPLDLERPRDIVERWVETETGLIVREGREGSRPELYRKSTLPAHRRWWRFDEPMPLIE